MTLPSLSRALPLLALAALVALAACMSPGTRERIDQTKEERRGLEEVVQDARSADLPPEALAILEEALAAARRAEAEAKAQGAKESTNSALGWVELALMAALGLAGGGAAQKLKIGKSRVQEPVERLLEHGKVIEAVVGELARWAADDEPDPRVQAVLRALEELKNRKPLPPTA